jgi:hypothetical protein
LAAGANAGREVADAAETPATTARAAARMMSDVFMTDSFVIDVASSIGGRGQAAPKRR